MFPPFLIQVIGVLLIAGLLLWGLSRLPWFDEGVKQVIRVIVIVVIGVWLIYLLMAVLGGANPRGWTMGR
jgi:hypothetical protein